MSSEQNNQQNYDEHVEVQNPAYNRRSSNKTANSEAKSPHDISSQEISEDRSSSVSANSGPNVGVEPGELSPSSSSDNRVNAKADAPLGSSVNSSHEKQNSVESSQKESEVKGEYSREMEEIAYNNALQNSGLTQVKTNDLPGSTSIEEALESIHLQLQGSEQKPSQGVLKEANKLYDGLSKSSPDFNELSEVTSEFNKTLETDQSLDGKAKEVIQTQLEEIGGALEKQISEKKGVDSASNYLGTEEPYKSFGKASSESQEVAAETSSPADNSKVVSESGSKISDLAVNETPGATTIGEAFSTIDKNLQNTPNKPSEALLNQATKLHSSIHQEPGKDAKEFHQVAKEFQQTVKEDKSLNHGTKEVVKRQADNIAYASGKNAGISDGKGIN